MKNRIAVLALAAAAVMSSAVTSWAFTSVGASTFPATVTTGGNRVSEATVAINLSTSPFTPGTFSTMTWSGVTPPSTKWKISDHLLVVNATVTDSGGGLQILTRNTASDAKPKFVDPTPTVTTNLDSNPMGLLFQDGSDSDTGQTLPLAWSIKSSTKVIDLDDAQRGLIAADPNDGPTAGAGNRFQWNFMQDEATPAIDFNGDGDTNDVGEAAFSDGSTAVTMINHQKLHVTQGDTGFQEDHNDGVDVYVYLQANFNTAAALQAYQTSTLTLESYTQ